QQTQELIAPGRVSFRGQACWCRITRREEDMRDSAVIPLVIVLVNVGERVLDSLLRKDSVAKSLKTSEDDKGTSRFIQVVAVIYVVVLLLTALLNQFQIGIVEP